MHTGLSAEHGAAECVHAETALSMIKRRLEAVIRGRTAWSQHGELSSSSEVFYRAVPNLYGSPFISSFFPPPGSIDSRPLSIPMMMKNRRAGEHYQ
jgi:hypothetical protein